MTKSRHLAIFPALCLAALTTQLRAADPLSYVPADANTLLLIDVAKVFASPLATRENWAQGHRSGSQPRILQPGTTQLTMAAHMETNTMETQWALAIVGLDRPVSMSNIAMNENGFPEQLQGKPAVSSPRNAYFVALDSTTLGVACPGDRQWTSRWLNGKLTSGAGMSAYLQQSAGNTGDAIVFAFDLENAASPITTRKSIMERSFDVLGDPSIDLNSIVRVLTGVRGLCFRINVGEQITGTCVITFSEDTGPMANVGKRLILDQLDSAGMDIPDLKQWQVKADGQTLACTGPLTTPGLFRLLSLIQLPAASSEAPPAAAAQSTAGAPATPAAAADSKVAASQAYFLAISRVLDGTSVGGSMGDSAAWLRRDAKRIDQLSLVNVDPDLMGWGAFVSGKLYESAGLLGVGQMQVTSSVASIGNPNVNFTQDEVGARTAYLNAAKQRQQAAMAQRAAAAAPVSQIVSEVMASRAKIRAQMVERYKVAF